MAVVGVVERAGLGNLKGSCVGVSDGDAVDGPGFDDLIVVPTDIIAVTPQDFQQFGVECRGASREIPPVGELGHVTQGDFLATTADHDRWQGIRLGLADGIFDMVVLAVESSFWLGPHLLDDLDSLAHLVDAGGCGWVIRSRKPGIRLPSSQRR